MRAAQRRKAAPRPASTWHPPLTADIRAPAARIAATYGVTVHELLRALPMSPAHGGFPITPAPKPEPTPAEPDILTTLDLVAGAHGRIAIAYATGGEEDMAIHGREMAAVSLAEVAHCLRAGMSAAQIVERVGVPARRSGAS